ncbi:peptidase associated/transthyretin-like domain-containing protein [Roseimaritima sediminicola]|uniref:hypothetical protein n=1 Tax=Roseimaritima sediminicola TaxID=2662066 RepID=UPI00129834C0|nr:hypothetical protein [Roseimaritima sediminicola]
MKFHSCCVLLALSCFAVLGCGPGGSEVSGTVLVGDQPAPRGTVNLDGEEGSYRGGIGEDGTFTIENVPEGSYQVAVAGVLDKAPASGMGEDMYNQSGPPPKSLIDPKYSSPTTSGLTLTVPSDTYDLTLDQAN